MDSPATSHATSRATLGQQAFRAGATLH